MSRVCTGSSATLSAVRANAAAAKQSASMLKIEHIYWLLGAFLLFSAALNARDRRYSMAVFWAILACSFLFGDAILAALAHGARWPAQAMGIGVLALGVMAARVRMTAPTD